MKLIYSELIKFLPDLSVKPEQLRDDITMIGHFTNYFEEIDGEIVFDLDIKVNRGDCLGYYGIARDLSVLYNIPLVTPTISLSSENTYQLPITVSTDKVKRIMAQKIFGLKNDISPPWLQKFVKLHGTNSINTLVDLTNYIMFLYGIPVHAFDTAKSTDNLIWEINSRFSEFTSLDGTKLSLNKDILMINNQDKPLSLSFWGGEACAIENATTDTIVEIAVYDRTTVRQNSRFLKCVTEAGTRLEKDLDPQLIPQALNHLCKLILENCGGNISSQTFDYYPQTSTLPQINFDPKNVSTIAGIDIPTEFSFDILTRLGCEIEKKDNTLLCRAPPLRQDITLEADLIEEVVRFWGYQKIPINKPLSFNELPDITPKIIYLIDELKDKLVALGYDEVLSWPLVNEALDSNTVITTQNSINTEVIYLRQSLIQSLKQQLDQYQRFKLPNPQFFEIGKIFSQKDGQYIEQTALGIYNFDSKKLVSDINSLNLPFIKGESEGIDNFIEIILDNLPKPEKYIPVNHSSKAIELTSQIITLDANLTLDTKEDPLSLIKKYSALIDEKILWSMQITDIYHDEKLNKYRYTFQVSYYNCDDKTAKKIHLSTFNLDTIK
jgi:phenylalanyl-tRNA synthetase beta chain